MTAVNVLFTRIAKEIEAKNPSNPIHFIVDFLCKNYAEHLHGFASIWNSDPELEAERQEVVHFFKHHKISTQISAHFTNAGYDTLETLATLTTETLADIETFNSVKWLPGHKVRLQQVFSDIGERVREYRQRQPPSYTISSSVAAPTSYQQQQHPSLSSYQQQQQQLALQHQIQQQQLLQAQLQAQNQAMMTGGTTTSVVVRPSAPGTSSSTAPVTALPPTATPVPAVGSNETVVPPGTTYATKSVMSSTGAPPPGHLTAPNLQISGLQLGAHQFVRK